MTANRARAALVLILAASAFVLLASPFGCGTSALGADFVTKPHKRSVPVEVHFVDRSKGHIDTWQWDLDDDGIIDSTERSPVYTYDVPGCYTITLTVRGPEGSDMERKEAYLELTAGPNAGSTEMHECVPCKADFVASPLEGEGYTWVDFTDKSTGNIVSREWDFNGDGQTDSTSETAQFLYKTNGFHSVTLKINGPGCRDSLTKKDYIHIGGCPT